MRGDDLGRGGKASVGKLKLLDERAIAT